MVPDVGHAAEPFLPLGAATGLFAHFIGMVEEGLIGKRESDARGWWWRAS